MLMCLSRVLLHADSTQPAASDPSPASPESGVVVAVFVEKYADEVPQLGRSTIESLNWSGLQGATQVSLHIKLLVSILLLHVVQINARNLEGLQEDNWESIGAVEGDSTPLKHFVSLSPDKEQQAKSI